jgi:pyruvate/2-oxoglutarate dehydrogenase complex dihydrolipoamide acyltransferase (E2) component
MPVQVIMPQLGESVIEGTVSKWLKSKGDQVEEFEPLLEVNTDKVDSEIPSPASGTLLEILVPEGTTVNAGTLLAWIGEEGETAPGGNGSPAEKMVVEKAEPVAAKPEPTAAASPAQGRDRELGFISPVVAKIANEEGIDLNQVEGTGHSGRITKKDVLAYLERRKQAPSEDQRVPHPEVAAPKVVPLPASSPAVLPGEVLPLSPVRQAIADHMVMSKRTSPHVTTVMEVDLNRVVAHRQANKEIMAREGVNLTFTAYFIVALANALKAYPIVNSSWSEGGIVLHRDINIGMATSLGEAGLIVPVIKNADRLSLSGIARAVNDLAQRARARQLKPDEVKEGTFTITNHGTSGSLFATPIINQPQCGILGVGAIQKRVVVISGENGDPFSGNMDAISIRPMVYVSLTFDHRILDGAIADYFLGKVVESLHNWK